MSRVVRLVEPQLEGAPWVVLGGGEAIRHIFANVETAAEAFAKVVEAYPKDAIEMVNG